VATTLAEQFALVAKVAALIEKPRRIVAEYERYFPAMAEALEHARREPPRVVKHDGR
jgi:hypothetical protein